MKVPAGYQHLIDAKKLLLDTDILIEIAKRKEYRTITDHLRGEKYLLLFSPSSLIELGFGPGPNVAKGENKLLKELAFRSNSPSSTYTTFDLRGGSTRSDESASSNRWSCVLPGTNEYFAARKALVSFMDDRGSKPKNARKLQVDAVLGMTAWNSGALMWTNNLRDHILAMYYARHHECTREENRPEDEVARCLARHIPPIVDTHAIEMILEGSTFDIYEHMISKIKDSEIKKALGLAASL